MGSEKIGWGDELMCAGEAQALYARDPRKVAIADIRKKNQVRYHHVWVGNPAIASPLDVKRGIECQLYYNGPENRPYIREKNPDRWIWQEYTPKPADIFFTPQEARFSDKAKGCIIIEPHTKAPNHRGKGGASPNKQWGWSRWQSLVRLADVHWVQVGPPGTRLLDGAELVQTPAFREAAAVLKGARAAVLPEGGLHHAAAAVRTPSVVIYGGYISPKQTGYDLHRNIFMGGEPCGSRQPCEHCRKALEAITPEMVADELKQLLYAEAA